MHAEYLLDPMRGPGYGLIMIYDCENLSEPNFIIKRLKDDKYLSTAGWRDDKISLLPNSSNAFEEGVVLYIGPEIVNELEADLHYQLELPGLEAMPLAIGKTMQSWVKGGEGVGLTPPPLPGTMDFSENIPENNIIYEGVEKSPEDLPVGDADNMPSGVASAENIEEDPGRKNVKKRGCFVLGAFLLTVWFIGGWFLWEGAKNAPVAPSSETVPFTLFPLGSANDDHPGDTDDSQLGKP